MLTFEKIFIMYIAYSILGWLMEVIVTLVVDKKLVNRGFLIGPYCPIYGVGYLAIITLLSSYMKHPIALFILIIILCSIIEYLTSLIMEKLFHARWWDYSNRKLNINGRICLFNSLAFGVIGIIGLYFINPFFTKIISSFSSSLINILFYILCLIHLIDIFISFNIMNKLKNKIILLDKDNTAEIKEKLTEIFNNNFLVRRLKNAFPKYEFNILKKFKKIAKRFKK